MRRAKRSARVWMGACTSRASSTRRMMRPMVVSAPTRARGRAATRSPPASRRRPRPRVAEDGQRLPVMGAWLTAAAPPAPPRPRGSCPLRGRPPPPPAAPPPGAPAPPPPARPLRRHLHPDPLLAHGEEVGDGPPGALQGQLLHQLPQGDQPHHHQPGDGLAQEQEATVAVVIRVSISGGRSPSSGRRPLTKVGIPTSKAAPVARIATGGEVRAGGPPKRRTTVNAATATPPATTRSQSHPRCALASPAPFAPPAPGEESILIERRPRSPALITAPSTASRSSTGVAKSSSARPVRGLTLTTHSGQLRQHRRQPGSAGRVRPHLRHRRAGAAGGPNRPVRPVRPRETRAGTASGSFAFTVYDFCGERGRAGALSQCQRALMA